MLDGKVCVITGAAKGIGRAVAQRFAREGGTVVLSDIDASALQDTASAVGGTAVTCDVTDEAAVEGLFAQALGDHGRVDVAVANAGIGDVSPLAEMSAAQWQRVLDVNLNGVFYTLKHAARTMAANGGGSIITMASITSFAGSPLIGHYAAAKAGALSVTRTLAVEMRDAGVRVNAICPGFLDTELVRDNQAAFEAALGVDDFEGMVINPKQGRLGRPDEVAGLAAWLASDRSSWVTGAAHIVDGGARASLL